MTNTIDARGLSCPQPVLMTMDEIKKGTANKIIVLVDNEAAKENVSRAALHKKWTIASIEEQELDFKITIHHGV